MHLEKVPKKRILKKLTNTSLFIYTLMSDINEDNIDYSIMQFTPLPNAVGKIWLESSSDSEDDEDEDEFVIESWATKDEDDITQQSIISFEEIEEIEEKEEYENSYEYKQKHLYHPPTQVNLIPKNLSRNNEKTSEDDDSMFDDVNEFAILADSIEEPCEIVLGSKEQQPLVKNTENNVKNDDENKIKVEKPNHNEFVDSHIKIEKKPVDGKERENNILKNNEIIIIKRNDYSNDLKQLQINVN